MKCPIDNVDLQMTERQGVEIDYCPQCRGIWLDRGELDKIIERSEKINTYPNTQEHRKTDFADKYDNNYDYRYDKNKKRKGLLGELFDF